MEKVWGRPQVMCLEIGYTLTTCFNLNCSNWALMKGRFSKMRFPSSMKKKLYTSCILYLHCLSSSELVLFSEPSSPITSGGVLPDHKWLVGWLSQNGITIIVEGSISSTQFLDPSFSRKGLERIYS